MILEQIKISLGGGGDEYTLACSEPWERYSLRLYLILKHFELMKGDIGAFFISTYDWMALQLKVENYKNKTIKDLGITIAIK